jgi:hypothetical protein
MGFAQLRHNKKPALAESGAGFVREAAKSRSLFTTSSCMLVGFLHAVYLAKR